MHFRLMIKREGICCLQHNFNICSTSVMHKLLLQLPKSTGHGMRSRYSCGNFPIFFFRQEANSDTVWKRLCKTKYGSDVVKERKVSIRSMGWKICFFVGLCRTVLVNTPEQQAIALVPYPGLTIKHMLNVIGIEKVCIFGLNLFGGIIH